MLDTLHTARPSGRNLRRAAALGLIAVAGLAPGGCGPEPTRETTMADPAIEAERLARDAILVDTHIDVPYRLQEKQQDISVRSPDGDFDYPRAKAGGLDAAFMSIYVPAEYQKTGGAKQFADGLIDMVESFRTRWPDKFAIALTPEDVRANFGTGVISLPMGMENGAGIEDDLANVAHFHERGIRYITLTHSENNQICDSSYAREKTWHGLSPFGREVVAEMNRVGIMVDISHLSDEAARQALEITRAPAIASHSSCRAFTPGWERNMDDDLIRALGANGGVIQINFGSGFLTKAANEQAAAFFAARKEYSEANHVDEHSDTTKAFEERYWKEHPKIYADVGDVVAHIDHVVQLIGVDHVGLGSDFDGVGDSLPVGLKDVSGYPNLIRALMEKGYSEADIRKICGENLLRVWSDVERVARELQAAGS